MAQDDFYDDEDAYKKRITDQLGDNTGIAGGGSPGIPADEFPSPVSSPTPKGGFDLEGIRGRLGFGKVDLTDPQGWLSANQDVATGASIRGDKMYGPGGEFLADIIGNAKAGGTRSQFLDGIGSDGQPRAAKAARTASAPAGAPATGGAAPMSDFNTQIRNLITSRIGQMSQAPSINDPALAAQSGAFNVAQQRGGERTRAAIAERAAANGGLNGGESGGKFDTDVIGLNEDMAQNQAGYDADLVGKEVQARRNEVQSLLNMALQSGDGESARQLTLLLAQMDEQLRRDSMAQQGSQFNANLGLQRDQMGQQRYMYDDTMGYNTWRANENDDYRNTVLGAFGG